MRASKELAKRLRFDLFPRPDFFRRRYFITAAVAAVAGLATWMLFNSAFRQRQYLPGPVSQDHATFGDRCEKCHTPFKSVANAACLECHPARTHSQFEATTPDCRDCHVEHRPTPVFLSVSNRTCLNCHGQLVSSRSPQPLIQTTIRTFATHPQFSPLREGRTDQAAVRFNHKIHLTSEKIPREQVGPSGKLQCADCHRVEGNGKLMQPLVFEPHCKRCHMQTPPSAIAGIETLHETPEIVRADVVAQLSVVGIQNAEAIFQGRERTLPGVADRPPLSQAKSLQKYLPEELEKLERALYKPFEETPHVFERNAYCFLCHLEDGERAAGELPKIKETKIPRRWLDRGEFSHRKHDIMACRTCHAAVEKSELTSDVNLPKKELCLQCHVDNAQRSAGTNCMLCHLYHDTSKNPEVRASKLKEVSIEVLTGR